MHHTATPTNPLLGALDYILEHVEEVSFAEWLTERRKTDSYHTIAADLESLTDGKVSLSRESIRRYCLELGVEVAA